MRTLKAAVRKIRDIVFCVKFMMKDLVSKNK